MILCRLSSFRPAPHICWLPAKEKADPGDRCLRVRRLRLFPVFSGGAICQLLRDCRFFSSWHLTFFRVLIIRTFGLRNSMHGQSGCVPSYTASSVHCGVALSALYSGAMTGQSEPPCRLSPRYGTLLEISVLRSLTVPRDFRGWRVCLGRASALMFHVKRERLAKGSAPPPKMHRGRHSRSLRAALCLARCAVTAATEISGVFHVKRPLGPTRVRDSSTARHTVSLVPPFDVHSLSD